MPSWRIKNYSPDEYIHTTENTDEDVYLKRHSKMEIEERRRKRFFFQSILINIFYVQICNSLILLRRHLKY